jgi:peptidyl-prolyl cis-trans isomerase C
MNTKIKSYIIYSISLLVGMLPTTAILASDVVLVQGKNHAITTQDILTDAQRIPPESRSLVLSQSDTVARIAGNLYVRRVMADQAQTAGMENDPSVSAALKIARDKVLSDAWLARLDEENTGSDAALQALARNMYTAKPEKFKIGERVRVRHILIADKNSDGLAMAEKTLAELKNGADFAALVTLRSADLGSKAKSGDIGLFERGRMAPEFETAAFAMTTPGELSGVVETQFGYHILKFEERRPAGVLPFEEVRDQIVKEIRETTRQNARAAAAQRIEESATMNRDAIDVFAKGQKAKP